MVEWLITALAALLGISPVVAVGLLVGVSVVGSAALRWYRRSRHEENYYLELSRSGSAFGAPRAEDREATLSGATRGSRKAARRRAILLRGPDPG
ncbi:MAG: hypothetical protein ABFS46_05560 [Myxococcota bacterium]